MKSIFNLFKQKTSKKMDNEKIILASAAIAACNYLCGFDLKEDKDSALIALKLRLEKKVDKTVIPQLIEDLEKAFPEKKESPVVTKPAESVKPAEPVKSETKPAPMVPAKEEPKEDAIPEEAIAMVKPFYDCKTMKKDAKEARKVTFDGAMNVGYKVELPAFMDEKLAKQYNEVYPTLDELELVLDEAWDMAQKNKSNAEITNYLFKNIGKYYVGDGFKTNNDYYKIANAYSKLVRVLRKLLGASSYEDASVSVTRPSYTLYAENEGDITLKEEFDLLKAEKPVETKSEPKAEMKNVQTQTTVSQKPDTKKAETSAKKEPVQDEEAQETEASSETAVKEETETSVEEVDGPPTVNKFDDFNEIENLIFEKLKAGNAKASKEKDPIKAKALKNEAKEDAQLLIQSRFDGEDWCEKDEKGYWKVPFLKYWNSIMKEIGTHANA